MFIPGQRYRRRDLHRRCGGQGDCGTVDPQIPIAKDAARGHDGAA